MRISDWSSDVCSSYLRLLREQRCELTELRNVIAQIERSEECGGPIEYHARRCVGDRQTHIGRISQQSCQCLPEGLRLSMFSSGFSEIGRASCMDRVCK